MPRPSCGLSAGVKRFNVGRTFERKHSTQKCDSHTKKSQSTTIVNDLVVAGNLLYLRTDFYPTALQVSVQYNYRFGDQRPTLDNNF